jgi:uncharacterized protein (TIRG00374 family)
MAIPRSFKRKLLTCIGLGAVVFLVLGLLPERQELTAAVGSFNWAYLPLALLLALLNYVIRFIRWQWYLSHLQISLGIRESSSIFMIGLMLSVTPGKAGELFKAYLVKLARNVPMSRTAPVVVVERLTDLTGTLILATSGLLVVQMKGWMIMSLWLVMWLGLWTLSNRVWMGALLRMLGRFIPASLSEWIERTYLSLAELLSPNCLLGGTLLAALAWFSECVSLLVILKGFGISVGWMEATFIYTLSTLAGAVLFFLPGGIGGTEVTMVTMLREISQVPTAVASLATVLTRMVTLWFAAAIGFLALFFCPLPVAEDVDQELHVEDEDHS